MNFEHESFESRCQFEWFWIMNRCKGKERSSFYTLKPTGAFYIYKKTSKSKSFKKSKLRKATQFDFYEAGLSWIALDTRHKFAVVRTVLKPEHLVLKPGHDVLKSEHVVLESEYVLSVSQPTGSKGNFAVHTRVLSLTAFIQVDLSLSRPGAVQ